MIEIEERDGRRLHVLTQAGIAEEPGLLIRMAIEQGRDEAARAALDDAQSEEPQSGEWPKLRGILELRVGNNDAAAEAFRTAEALGASARDCQLGRAGALLAIGMADEAFELLSGAMADNPRAPELAQWLLRAGAATGRLAEVAPHLAHYLSLEPEDDAIRFAFASVNARLGRWRLARTHHERLRRSGAIRGLQDLERVIEEEQCAA